MLLQRIMLNMLPSLAHSNV